MATTRGHHVLTLRASYLSRVKGMYQRQVIVLAQDENHARLVASETAKGEGAEAWMSIRFSSHKTLAKSGKSRVICAVTDVRTGVQKKAEPAAEAASN